MIGDVERETGLRAYEQTLAFAALRRRRMPLIYVLFTLVLAVAGLAFLLSGGVYAKVGVGWWVAAVIFAIAAARNWRHLRARDAQNRALLARLHAQYGDDLPWLEVERHLAALEKLQAEIGAEESTDRR